MSSRQRRSDRGSPIIGTTQSKIVGVLGLAVLALSFAVALKTTNFGAAFAMFIIGALVLMLSLFDLTCLTTGSYSPRGFSGCNIWATVKAILIGIALVGAILLGIAALSAPAVPRPQPIPIAPMPVPLIPRTA